MPNIIAIESLQPGMVILRIIEQTGSVKIKKSGLVTSVQMAQGLAQMGVQSIEVDPQQRVEIEKPEVKKTHTKKTTMQKMLHSNNASKASIENSLSEQFNRNLFLPSVQDMPSPWQIYSTRYLLVALMVLGGAGCGWTVSQYPYLLALVHDWQQPSLVTQPTAVTVPSTSLTLEADIVGSGTNNISAVDLLVADTSRADSPGAAMPNAQQGLAKTPPALTPLAEPEPAPTSAPPRISADLLKRFNQALSEVTDTPASEPLADTSTNGVVPRVDQLPAWVLTELPNLSFSAHMYASNDEQRWVRVNGIRMVEGDLIDNKVQIIQIAPQKVILTYAGQAFSMAALTDW